jgi:hypothetical protein
VAPVSFSTTTVPSTFQSLAPTLVSSPYTPNTAPTMTATMIPPNTAPIPRRSGDCAGSVSRMTNAEITRCIRNW